MTNIVGKGIKKVKSSVKGHRKSDKENFDDLYISPGSGTKLSMDLETGQPRRFSNRLRSQQKFYK